MNLAEKQRLIDLISWGCVVVSEKNADGKPIQLILHPPTAEIKAKSALLYQVAYQEAIEAGMLPEEQEIQSYIDIDKWNPQTDIEIEGLRNDIHNIRKGLLGLLFNKEKLESARSMLRLAEKALTKRFLERQELLKTSADAYALLRQQRYIIGQITRTLDNQRYWVNDNAFDEEMDIDLVTRLYTAFFEKSKTSLKQIREIARSSPWREFWASIKSPDHIFFGPSINWSELQKDLVYWSYAYDIVSEAYERPTKEIIEDDDLLDSWFIRQSDKVEEKAKQDLIELPAHKGKKTGRKEQFIVSDREGAKAVYALNDGVSRAKVKAKQALLSKHGKIKEQNLPESQIEMRELAMAAQSEKVKGIHRK